jgi:signal peptidase II
MPSPDPDAGAGRAAPPAADAPGAAARAAGAGRRARFAALMYSTAAALFVLDRVTKVLAEHTLPGHPRTLIPGVLQLQYTTNPGGAFGLFGGATWLFLVATIAVSAVILFASFNLPNRTLAIALGLVFGGAIGNLTDRVLNGSGLSGRVVDFLAFARAPDAPPVWPVFNMADSAIVVGAALIVLASLRRTVSHR